MRLSVMGKCAVILFILFSLCSAAMAERIIVFAALPSWPPAEDVDKEGRAEGYAIDYMKAAGRAAGFTPEFEIVAREDALEGLVSGKYDALIASSLRVKDRMDEIAVSKPFFKTRQVLLVRKGTRFNTEESFGSARIGALSDANGLALLEQMEGVDPVIYSDVKSAVNDLIARKLDAFVCDYPVAAYYSESKFNNFVQITTFFREPEPNFYTIAVKKGNSEVLEVINAGIAAVKAKGVDRELRMIWKWL